MEMAKRALLAAMAVVFCVFLVVQLLGTVGIRAVVDISIATAVILIGLFVVFIVVSERERKRRKPGS